MLFFDFMYFIFILLASPLGIKYLFKKEYREILKHRLSPDIEKSNKKRIWIHAVSVGEVRSLKNLMRELIKEYPNHEMVLSVTTPAGFRMAKKEYPHLAVINSPVDFSFTIRRFIKKINPQILILNELELWPNWIAGTHRKKIPILLINGRVSDTAYTRYETFKFLLKPFFNKIDGFLVQAELYRERFLELGVAADKLTVCGNIKADEAFKTSDHLPPHNEIAAHLGIDGTTEPKKKIITIASSHQTDEILAIAAIKQLTDRFRFIIVPRHLDRVSELEKLLETHKVAIRTWSKNNTEARRDEVLIYDSMGYLFNILKISDIVFMGGTLERKVGGHNLYEPAALGKLIVGGPCYNNFPAIGAELVEKKVYHVINTPDELTGFLAGIKDTDLREAADTAVDCVEKRKGSIQCILTEIRRSLN
ncbi:MAG: hypothetical protein GY765_16455 [bacterium]|nr:hypothetical protein [bacterium]